MRQTKVQSRRSSLGVQMPWLAAGLLTGFAVPFLFTDVLALPRDLYYGIYAAIVVGFVALWARSTGVSLTAAARRHWVLAIVLGVLVALLLATVVVRTEPPTPGPTGVALIWAVLWQGLVYGAVDGLLLSVFPILAVFAAMQDSHVLSRRGGRVLVGGVALLASLVMTAVYHLGYTDFRSPALAKPVGGDVVWSLPTLVTLNPVGAPIAHAGMHIAAVLHSPGTTTFLPPHD